MVPSFGLDLGGLSSKKTSLARAERDGSGILVTVYTGPGIRHQYPPGGSIREVQSTWGKILEECLEQGPLLVDAPIDLQGLPDAPDPQFVWQLTHRPIDYVLDALPPLASFIGYLTSALRCLAGKDPAALGERLFETYPAGSLKLMREPGAARDLYKGQRISMSGGRWTAEGSSEGLSSLLTNLAIQAPEETKLTDDQVDALLCAVTGLEGVASLTGEPLRQKLQDRFQEKAALLTSIPKGYCLLSERPAEVSVRTSCLSLDKLLVDIRRPAGHAL